MENTIIEIKKLLCVALANAPEKYECTEEANKMFEDMQRLRKSIERFEVVDGGIHNDEYTEDDYANIEQDHDTYDYVASCDTRFEYNTLESAMLRMTEIEAILDNGDFHCQDEWVELEDEYQALERYINARWSKRKAEV